MNLSTPPPSLEVPPPASVPRREPDRGNKQSPREDREPHRDRRGGPAGARGVPEDPVAAGGTEGSERPEVDGVEGERGLPGDSETDKAGGGDTPPDDRGAIDGRNVGNSGGVPEGPYPIGEFALLSGNFGGLRRPTAKGREIPSKPPRHRSRTLLTPSVQFLGGADRYDYPTTS